MFIFRRSESESEASSKETLQLQKEVKQVEKHVADIIKSKVAQFSAKLNDMFNQNLCWDDQELNDVTMELLTDTANEFIKEMANAGLGHYAESCWVDKLKEQLQQVMTEMIGKKKLDREAFCQAKLKEGIDKWHIEIYEFWDGNPFADIEDLVKKFVTVRESIENGWNPTERELLKVEWHKQICSEYMTFHEAWTTKQLERKQVREKMLESFQLEAKSKFEQCVADFQVAERKLGSRVEGGGEGLKKLLDDYLDKTIKGIREPGEEPALTTTTLATIPNPITENETGTPAAAPERSSYYARLSTGGKALPDTTSRALKRKRSGGRMSSRSKAKP